MIQINPLQSYIDGGARAAITSPPSASLVFDLPGRAIWVKGVKLKGTDHTYTFSHDTYISITNTPGSNESEDIKIGINTTLLKLAIDTTYGVVSASVDGLAPKFSNANKATASAATTYNFLGIAGSTLKWYQLPWRNVRINTESTDVLGVNSTDPLIISSGDGIEVTWDSTNKRIVITNSKPHVFDNTDFQVSQIITSTNNDYRVLLKRNANNDDETGTIRYASTLLYNPSTKILKVNGNRVVTFADLYVGATSSAAGTEGLVPAASSANRNKFLRGDGTWQVPTNDNTWRPVKVEGTQKLASTNTDALDFHGDTGIEITYDATNKKINIKNTAPDVNHNTDRTGVKLGTVTGSKKTDGTLIITNSSAGLVFQGGTNLFKIGDGTNYIEVPVTPSFTVTDKSANILTSLTTIATIAGTDIKAKITVEDKAATIGTSATTIATIGGTSITAKIGAYLPLAGGTMTGTPYINMPASAATISDSQPFGITYGRIQGYSNINIAADTDGSTSEYVIITAGYSVANSTRANGLAVGYNTLTWKNNIIAHAGNIENKAATIGTSLTTIATIAGVDITAKIGSYAASSHTHTVKINGSEKTIAAPGGTAVDLGSYLPLAGGTMDSGAMIIWKDWGQWGASSPTYPKANGGLQWSGTSDNLKLFVEETASDDLRLILQCGDDASPQFNIRNYLGTTTVSLHSNGTITGTSIVNSGSNNNYVLLGGGGTKLISDFATSGHTHSLSIAADSGTNQLTLAPSSKYKLTAGGSTFIFTTPTDENVKQIKKTDNTNRPLMMINGGTSAGDLTSTSMFSTSIYANASTNMITANGFIKSGFDDTSVLLAGGGAKALSDFAMADLYVKKAGDTMTGNIAFTNTGATSGNWLGIYGTIGDNDSWCIRGSQPSTNAGFLEIATGDDGTEPIYVRQYGGTSDYPSVQVQNINPTISTAVKRQITLLDGSGNTTFPGNIYIDTADTDKFIMFRYNSNNYAGASWRLLSRGTGSSDTNYFDIETGGSNSGTNTWYRVIRLTMDSRRVGINTDSVEKTLDINGITQIYQRGNDNTAFKNLFLIKQQNSTESGGDGWSVSNPSFGIGFNRYWTSGSSPYGETTCAGIYATVSSSWRGGLVFRTKNNQTQGGTHDVTALRLAPSGTAFFVNNIQTDQHVYSYGFHHRSKDDNNYILFAGGSYGHKDSLVWYTWEANLSSLSNTNYYPVLVAGLPYFRRIRIRVGGEHSANFSERGDGKCYIWYTEEISGSGWSGDLGLARIIFSHEEWGGNGKAILHKVTQMTNSSREVFWLRGGSTYYISSDYYGLSVECGATSYTYSSQTVDYVTGLRNFNRLNLNVDYFTGQSVGIKARTAQSLLINGVTWLSSWNWDGKSGQPTWLWGSNDGVNMYVWNPSNFSVNYATSAGSATSAGKLTTVSKTAWGLTYWTASGVPTSISGNMTDVGSITFTALTGTNSRNLLYQSMADNDYFRLTCGATASNSGYVEFVTGDDGTEPIYFKLASSATLTLLDSSHNSTFPGMVTALCFGVSNTDSATGRGISLYNGATSGAPTYGIMFAGTGTFGTHGAVTSDWATYFTMSDTTNRGWIFRRGSTNVASIDGTGKLYLGYPTSTANPGIYWNPLVESTSDGTDTSAIYQIKSGVAGGTELRISQANDSNDVINIVSPYYIYLNSKRAFTINDSWLRINENLGFSSGIYTGSSLVRSDNQLQVGSGGANFYANSSGNGYFSNTLGIAGTNTSYKLYVNGSGYITGETWLNSSIYIIADPGISLLQSSYGLRSDYTSVGHPTEEYLKAWTKYAYAKAAGRTALGIISPNSRGFIQADIYASGINSTSGLPEHITVRYYPHGGSSTICGTSYGTWYFRYGLDTSSTIPYATSAGSATTATTLLTNNTSQAGDSCYNANPGLHFYRFNGTGNTIGGGDGWIMQWSWNPGSVGGQIYVDDNPSGIMGIRGCTGSSGTSPTGFTAWWRVYTDAYHPLANSVPWTGVTGVMQAGNEFNIPDSGYGHASLWFNYMPRNSRSANSTLLTDYYFGNLGGGYASLNAAHYYEQSDIRLKHDISSVSESIRRFRFKDDSKFYYGFIAQELEKSNPEVVNTQEKYWTVNYNSAICLVISKLENRVKELEDKLKKYEEIQNI